MAKLNHENLISKRNMVVLILRRYHNLDGVQATVSISNLIADEFRALSSKCNPAIIEIAAEKDEVRDSMSASLLDVLYNISLATKPTIIESSCSLEENPVVSTYLEFMVAASGGFIIELHDNRGETCSLKSNCSLPIIRYNVLTDSWFDVQEKVKMILRQGLEHSSVTYMTMLTSFLPEMARMSGSFFLGDVSRSYITVPDESNKLKNIIILSGNSTRPISLFEYADKIWRNERLMNEQMDPERCVICREYSPVTQIVMSKLLSNQDNLASDFKVISI